MLISLILFFSTDSSNKQADLLGNTIAKDIPGYVYDNAIDSASLVSMMRDVPRLLGRMPPFTSLQLR